MKILIAGATGFLGSELFVELAQNGYEVVAGVRRSSNLHSLHIRNGRICDSIFLDQDVSIVTEEIRKRSIELIIQCVCDYGRTNNSPVHVASTNLMVPLQLMQAAENAAVSSFINMGTSLPANVNAYALAKQQFAQWLSDESRIAKRVELSLEQFYGPGESVQQFVTWLIHQFQSEGRRVELTAGEQKRDLIFIDDLVEAIRTVVANLENLPTGFHRISIGSGKAYRIRELVTLVQNKCGASKVEVQFGAKPYRKHEVMYSIADVRFLHSLGWNPETDIADGVERCIDFVKQQQQRKAA